MFEVDLTTVLQVAGSALLGLLSVGAVWARGKIMRYLDIKEDSETRAYLDQAISNGIRAVDTKMGVLIDQHGRVQMQDEQTAAIVRYVTGHVPDAVNHFELSREQIEDMVAARIGQTVSMDRWQAARAVSPQSAAP